MASRRVGGLVPATPFWIDTSRSGTGGGFRLLAENAVVVPSPASDRLAAIAAEHGVWLVIGIQEREPNGSTIYNTLLYLSPEGTIVEKHRKLVPTGSERTVWGMGDGSTLRSCRRRSGGSAVIAGELQPLARFPVRRASTSGRPTLARAATVGASMQHIARENECSW